MGHVREVVATLPPGSFAFVMATGIVSIGMDQQGFVLASRVLLVIALVAWVLLLLALGTRCVLYRERVIADLHDPVVAFGFFTVVAGTDVLAVRLVNQYWQASAAMLAFAAVVGLFLGYGVPWAAALGRAERPVLQHVNGTWFIWVVASQSVATAAASIEPQVTTGRAEIAVLAVATWSVGIVLYAACAVFVALRILLYPFSPSDLNPPYWVSMGAMAITVVAGAKIVEMESTPIIDVTSGLIGGLSVLGWAWATWLIPVLFAVGVWRHLLHRIPLTYEATWWSIVFPLGMYAVAGMYIGRADSLPIVEAIGSAWLWVGASAWLYAAVQMARSSWRRRHDAGVRSVA
ncbi:tellurite resistance/C4-dicarboxylate transporter family protein [Janibacter cremeus]|uniref:tellurite resistance/C4-dicarboxylate transporter family protein n=1 Tax=Janibacter cremeus TaxID=1285192 RepID=UPI0023FA158E|nr:tellurite resistance/C4-dicarboxylate transporter family protein [Janibacter cremeus]WEV78052.1 tellurite resistance/C4-dicarboxylate transporter family protein [Janibacter cremeus]